MPHSGRTPPRKKISNDHRKLFTLRSLGQPLVMNEIWSRIQRRVRKTFVSENKRPGQSQHAAENISKSVSFPDGIDVWHEPHNAAFDICFIHGLTGDREMTWTADAELLPWPKKLLPTDFDRARILTYGYDAYIMKRSSASTNTVINHAENFLLDLANVRYRQGSASRPLIIIAHSLGGIVCKKAILISRHNTNRRLESIFNSIKGVIFMGTPHKGSWMADWANIPAKALSILKSTNTTLLETLGTKSDILEQIHRDFSQTLREVREDGRTFRTFCFYEELAVEGFSVIVRRKSAIFDDENPGAIHANHIDMVKFKSATDTGYQRLVGELRAWEKDIVSQEERLNVFSFRRQAKRNYRGSDMDARKRRRMNILESSVSSQESIETMSDEDISTQRNVRWRSSSKSSDDGHVSESFSSGSDDTGTDGTNSNGDSQLSLITSSEIGSQDGRGFDIEIFPGTSSFSDGDSNEPSTQESFETEEEIDE